MRYIYVEFTSNLSGHFVYVELSKQATNRAQFSVSKALGQSGFWGGWGVKKMLSY